VPVSRWHQRQWQAWTINGLPTSRYRTCRHVHPPSMFGSISSASADHVHCL